jgi:DNA-binding transcriptional ArsR family regulator
MVTDDELSNIIRLRGVGWTHQEIADELKLTRQTVAYHLSKLKDTATLEKPVRVIKSSLQNNGNVAIIRLSIDQFEELRENELIYADGAELFEMRGNSIHSCGWPQNRLHPNRISPNNPNQWFVDNYGALVPFIPTMLEQNPGGVEAWISTLSKKINVYNESIRGASNRTKTYNRSARHMRQVNLTPMHPLLTEMIQIKKQEMVAARNSAQRLPTSMFECALLLLKGDFPTPPSDLYFDEHEYATSRTIKVDLAERLGLTLREVEEWLKTPASRDPTISRKEFLESGASGETEFHEMKNLGFQNAESFRMFQSVCRTITGRVPSRVQRTVYVNMKQHTQQADFDSRDEAIASFVRYGWTDSSDIENALGLGLHPSSEETYRKMLAQVRSWGLGNAPLPALRWLRNNNMQDERYQGFDAPRSAALYHLISESKSNRFLLDALVDKYNAFEEPGMDLNKSQLCGLLSSAPFDALVVATLESGLVEKMGEQTEVREVIREVEVAVVKEVELIKEVEQTSSVKALFALSSYQHFTKLLQNNKIEPIREAAEMLCNAINRGELKPSYKEAWAVFGAVAREVVDSETEGDFNKKLIEEVGEQIALSKSDKDDLHKLRMIRNDIDKVKVGSNRRPTVKHLQRCMALIDRLISEMPMTRAEVPHTSPTTLLDVTKDSGPVVASRSEAIDVFVLCPDCGNTWEFYECCDWCGWSGNIEEYQ